MRSVEELIPLLQSRTDEGSLKWNKSDNGFGVPLNSYEFYIFQWTDPEDGQEGLSLWLRDAAGTQIDSAVANDYEPLHDSIAKLYRAARRSAYQVDDVIAGLEQALKK